MLESHSGAVRGCQGGGETGKNKLIGCFQPIKTTRFGFLKYNHCDKLQKKNTGTETDLSLQWK